MSNTSNGSVPVKGRAPGSKLFRTPEGKNIAVVPGNEPAGSVLVSSMKPADKAAPSNGAVPVPATPVPLPASDVHDIGNGRVLSVYSLRGVGGMVLNTAMISGEVTDYSPDGFTPVGSILVFTGQGNIPAVNGNRRTLVSSIETLLKAALIDEADLEAAAMRDMERELANARAAVEARIKGALGARRTALGIGAAPVTPAQESGPTIE